MELVVVAIGLIILIVRGIFVVVDEASKTRAAVETEAKLIHRRIDDLTGEIQLLQSQPPAKEDFYATIEKLKAKVKATPKVYDYESSQRATLEEFKEQ